MLRFLVLQSTSPKVTASWLLANYRMASLMLLLEALVRSRKDIDLQGQDEGLFFDAEETGDNNTNMSLVTRNKDHSYCYCGWIVEAEDVPSWKIISQCCIWPI